MEASDCLCTSMLEGGFTSQYSSTRVLIHLTRQSIELFLKAALQALGQPTERLGHNLNDLFVEYRRNYPELSFHFEIPARFQVTLDLDLFPKTIDPFHKTLDQRHRYATDKAGSSFTTPESFDPAAFQEELGELSRALGILEWAEIKPFLRAKNAP